MICITFNVKKNTWENKPFHYNFKETKYAFCKTNTDRVKCFIGVCNAKKNIDNDS